jgi:hypothetical protein
MEARKRLSSGRWMTSVTKFSIDAGGWSNGINFQAQIDPTQVIEWRVASTAN